jgi:gamma-glutamylcyclotransferase (GGCT)/AIG2-like uncharacterized protein YtfP
VSANTDLPAPQETLYDARRRTPPEQEARRSVQEESPDATFYEDVVKIPGFGGKPQRCQDYHAVGFCREEGHVLLGQRSCSHRGCPDHWRDWLQQSVANGVARLAAWRHVQEGAGKRLLHAVFSPDQDRKWSARDVFRIRGDSYEVADAVGVDGGRMWVHPYRTSDRADTIFETVVESGDWDEEDGKWKLIRDMVESGDWEETQEFVEAAPHYHGLVACEDFDSEGAPEGWVAKNIRSLPRFHWRDVESYRPMARVAWYIGTHSAVAELMETTDAGEEVMRTKASTTWFGDLHPAAFDPEEELGRAKWEKIQEMAERAVTTEPGGTPEEMECPRDGCESVVEPIERLEEYVGDEGWMESLEPKQRVRMRGLELWLVERLDRPPPGRRGTKESLMTWLERKGGEVYREGPVASTSPASSQGRFS